MPPTIVAELSSLRTRLAAEWRIVESMPPSAHRETDPQPVRSLEFRRRFTDVYWHPAESWHEETGRNIPTKVAAWALEHQTRTPDPVRPRNQTGPTRSGVVVIFFLLWCAAMLGGTLVGMRTPHTVAAVEQRWHGPAHEHPADYARDYSTPNRSHR